jgi:hypothetical protein
VFGFIIEYSSLRELLVGPYGLVWFGFIIEYSSLRELLVGPYGLVCLDSL